MKLAHEKVRAVPGDCDARIEISGEESSVQGQDVHGPYSFPDLNRWRNEQNPMTKATHKRSDGIADLCD